MGAILKLDKMPSRCNECIFANEDISWCRLRNSRIIAGKSRNCRMPLCPLQNEGEYISRILKSIHHQDKIKQTPRG